MGSLIVLIFTVCVGWPQVDAWTISSSSLFRVTSVESVSRADVTGCRRSLKVTLSHPISSNRDHRLRALILGRFKGTIARNIELLCGKNGSVRDNYLKPAGKRPNSVQQQNGLLHN